MKSRPYDKVICLDFDDVINHYKGWRNEGFNVILDDEPIHGVKQAITMLRKNHLVVVHSVRCSHRGGRKAIIDWLNKHGIHVDKVCVNKPLADIYIDDRGITFDGSWQHTFKKIKNFKQWSVGKEGIKHLSK